MFGIGFPELILILALALIVVGPDKLPELARSIAKTLVDLKKTAEGLKESMNTDDNPLNDIKPTLEDAAKNFQESLLDQESASWKVPEDLKELNKADRVTEEYSINNRDEAPSPPAEPDKVSENSGDAEAVSSPGKGSDSTDRMAEDTSKEEGDKPRGEKA